MEKYVLQVHKAILTGSTEDSRIAADIEMAMLCEAFHVLPSWVEAEDPVWVSKLKIIAHEQAEKERRDSKNA